MNCMRILGVVLCATILVGCEKARLDDEVRRLCAVDGGVKVYEKVVLPPSRFDKNGVINIPSKNDAKSSDDFYYESGTNYLKKGDPDLRRDHTKIIRRSDGKILGESIYYARRGGDIPGPWHPSSFGCPQIGSEPSMESSIFLKGEDK